MVKKASPKSTTKKKDVLGKMAKGRCKGLKLLHIQYSFITLRFNKVSRRGRESTW